ncbi:MAG: hypothetical protein ACI89T_000456 [Cognaticolwellia sp.]|jgi:hypothetical protein
MKNLAPIALGTYTRLAHLKETVYALQQNTLAQMSELYVFSDAPQPGDEAIVSDVRTYLSTISGFKKVHIIKRQKNGRVANNRGGIQELLQEYGKVIFLEDDNITATGFLAFMNDALHKYQNHPHVLSICGYTPKFEITDELNYYDNLALPRFVGWGIALWQEKFNLIPSITPKDYKQIIMNAETVKYINHHHGRDLINRFRAESLGHIDGLDNKGCFLQTQTNMFSVHPKHSLVNNIGNDGSGVHSSKNDKYDIILWDKSDNFILDNDISLNEGITQQSIEFFSPNDQDMSPEIIDNIINQLQAQNITNVTLWGIDVLTGLFIQHMPPTFKINHIVDSWADSETTYKQHKVITPKQAYELGEKTFVIMSFSSRFKIQEAALNLAKDLNVIMYQAEPLVSSNSKAIY